MPAKLQVEKYELALERLVARGDPVSLDAVAREAGSGAGSIKSSRAGYAALIKRIEEAAARRVGPLNAEVSDRSPELKKEVRRLSNLLDEALEREINLLEEVFSLRDENRQLRVGRPLLVVPRTP